MSARRPEGVKAGRVGRRAGPRQPGGQRGPESRPRTGPPLRRRASGRPDRRGGRDSRGSSRCAATRRGRAARRVRRPVRHPRTARPCRHRAGRTRGPAHSARGAFVVSIAGGSRFGPGLVRRTFVENGDNPLPRVGAKEPFAVGRPWRQGGKSERRQVQAPTAALGTPPQGVLPTHTGVGLCASGTTVAEPHRHEVILSGLALHIDLDRR